MLNQVIRVVTTVFEVAEAGRGNSSAVAGSCVI